MKPVTFSVDYELEHPESGPMLDDGWPTSLKVSVRAAPSPGGLTRGFARQRGRNPCWQLELSKIHPARAILQSSSRG